VGLEWVTRGAIVRLTTDRLASEGAPAGSRGLTLGRHREHDDVWVVQAGRSYANLAETEFEVVDSALMPRGVTLPSLNGGWLTISPLVPDSDPGEWLLETLSRELKPGDFLGQVSVYAGGNATGFPVIWDREHQLALMYFFNIFDRITGRFPYRTKLKWDDTSLEIEGVVTFDLKRGFDRRSVELIVTTRNPGGDLRECCTRLIVPTGTCDQFSRWLTDLFPSVTEDDRDWV
jgi:hypothetical protein